ncbi:MAG: OmpA family protein [Deltaproteobacteria bacterium]|nr:OmpA family protein [Deltaproteobacteria bacterium]
MRRLLPLLLASPFLLASKCGRKVDDEKVDDKIDVPPPEVTLQVAAIDPSYGSADQSFPAEVFGNGFERGAQVDIAGRPIDTRFRDESTLAVTVPALAVGTYDVRVENPDGTRASLRKGLTITQSVNLGNRCSAVTVRFGFDSSVLDASSRGQIERAAECLRGSTDFVRVEGHCDDRGTTDYNIALGQRRADAVARYLVSLGVSPSRTQSVSYGEERPVASGSGEAAWAENRRVEIVPGGGR